MQQSQIDVNDFFCDLSKSHYDQVVLFNYEIASERKIEISLSNS